jgi:DsbC/DsbD-like thiol-disulfide interchange protein
MRFLLFSLLVGSLFVGVDSTAQDNGPVSWKFSVRKADVNGYRLVAEAAIDPGWHIYSQFLAEGGPIPTTISLSSGSGIPVGLPGETGEKKTFYDTTYDCEISWYSGHAMFSQLFKPANEGKALKGVVEYLACDSFTCVPARMAFDLKY